MIVSVIIPTFNRSRFIRLTLESFVKQNFERNNFEIIIADNNSSDNTAEVVSSFIEAHSDFRIRYFLEKRQGVHYARNSAAKLATGAYLYFTDDDMIAEPGLLSGLLDLFSLDGKVASVTGVVLPKWEVEPPGWILKLCNNALLSLNDPPYDLMISAEDCNVFSCHQMIRRHVFFESGGFNPENTRGEWIGDGETGLNIKIREMGYKFGFSRKSVIHHIIPPSRITQQYLNKRLANQGNCDSYTYYRKHQPASNALFFINIGMFLRLVKQFLKFMFKRIKPGVSWRLNLANCHYYHARIKYNRRLQHDPEWRKLVLKMNWIEE